MKKNKSKMSPGKKMAIGAGVAAVASGAYYLLGPKSKTHQKKAKVLLGKIKKEVQSEVRKAKSAIKKSK